ncbi:MAG: non-homologous end-joining DNA ligase, partial [Gammaproteobacteria bacterium]|nr:non-homologous end-joining DNA ligase [Gammaproteobacteria bacterium]
MPSRRLETYRDKRHAGTTPEPFGRLLLPKTGKLFVVQQHHARHLHWDLRLELDGVLLSWAVPKGPSRNPKDKRFAAHVEDHPLDYADFEGRIPEGNYGAGHVIIWDKGTYVPLNNFKRGLENGKLLFELKGHKLHGRWTLVRMKGASNKTNEWLFIKETDQWAKEDAPYTDDSIHSGLTVAQLKNPRRKAARLLGELRKTSAKLKERTVSIKPMLASSGEIFDNDKWLYELKYDGYRLLAEKNASAVTLHSRNGHDLTASFPEIAQSVFRLPFDQFLIDGELVVHDEQGVPSFSLLQQRARLSGELEVARAAIEMPCTYYVFDALQILNYDLRELALIKRKSYLRRLLPSQGPLRLSEHITAQGKSTYEAAIKLGMEGVVAKQTDSLYRSGRSNAWTKVRHQRTDDFVIVGWLPNRSNALDLGSLALGEYRNSELTYIGRVGSGLGSAKRKEVLAALDDLPLGKTLIDENANSRIVWVEPSLVCEVDFKEYTRDGQLRQPVFRRLRDDKVATECRGRFDNPISRQLTP